MQERNIALCIVLSIVTCGIYGLYWYVTLADGLNAATGEEDTSGGLVLLFTIITCGIYGLFWCYKAGEKVDMIRQRRGESGGNNGIVYLILTFIGLGIVTYALIQNELNKLSTPQY